jgi:hypothetical protein
VLLQGTSGKQPERIACAHETPTSEPMHIPIPLCSSTELVEAHDPRHGTNDTRTCPWVDDEHGEGWWRDRNRWWSRNTGGCWEDWWRNLSRRWSQAGATSTCWPVVVVVVAHNNGEVVVTVVVVVVVVHGGTGWVHGGRWGRWGRWGRPCSQLLQPMPEKLPSRGCGSHQGSAHRQEGRPRREAQGSSYHRPWLCMTQHEGCPRPCWRQHEGCPGLHRPWRGRVSQHEGWPRWRRPWG